MKFNVKTSTVEFMLRSKEDSPNRLGVGGARSSPPRASEIHPRPRRGSSNRDAGPTKAIAFHLPIARNPTSKVSVRDKLVECDTRNGRSGQDTAASDNADGGGGGEGESFQKFCRGSIKRLRCAGEKVTTARSDMEEIISSAKVSSTVRMGSPLRLDVCNIFEIFPSPIIHI